MPTPTPFAELANLPQSVREWLRNLKNTIDSGSGAISWTSVSKSGANITDLPTRLHTSLQSMQGGDASNQYHLKIAIKASKVHDFASIASGASANTTITTTGATTTNVVALGYSSTPEDGIEFRAHVSSADTVTLTAINRTAAAIDPASRTYYVLAMEN